jgi:hypothetical protein
LTVEKAGGLPKYIERVARHIRSDSGYSVSRAIAAAVSQTKKRAAKGNKAAIKAIAQWERMKASSNVSASVLAEVDAGADISLIEELRLTAMLDAEERHPSGAVGLSRVLDAAQRMGS